MAVLSGLNKPDISDIQARADHRFEYRDDNVKILMETRCKKKMAYKKCDNPSGSLFIYSDLQVSVGMHWVFEGAKKITQSGIRSIGAPRMAGLGVHAVADLELRNRFQVDHIAESQGVTQRVLNPKTLWCGNGTSTIGVIGCVDTADHGAAAGFDISFTWRTTSAIRPPQAIGDCRGATSSRMSHRR